MTASNHAFSAFSFISFVLTFIPFAWHLEGEPRSFDARFFPYELRPDEVTYHTSMEHRNLHLYGMDRPGLSLPVHQLCRLGRQRNKLGPRVLRHRH